MAGKPARRRRRQLAALQGSEGGEEGLCRLEGDLGVGGRSLSGEEADVRVVVV